MASATFEDHPTDPDKVILRKKPYLDKGRDYEEGFVDGMQHQMQSSVDKAVNRMAQPKQDNAYIYASNLAKTIWQKHYMKESPKFALLDTTEGVLTQIDNMTCGLVREKPAQPEQEPVGKLQEPTAERAWFTIAELNAWANKKLLDNPQWVMPTEEPERKEALAQEQEPVGQLLEDAFGRGQVMWFNKPKDESMLYTTPPQRKPLTRERLVEMAEAQCGAEKTFEDWVELFGRDIEAAHGIKE